jgi:hypothetical protein
LSNGCQRPPPGPVDEAGSHARGRGSDRGRRFPHSGKELRIEILTTERVPRSQAATYPQETGKHQPQDKGRRALVSTGGLHAERRQNGVLRPSRFDIGVSQEANESLCVVEGQERLATAPPPVQRPVERTGAPQRSEISFDPAEQIHEGRLANGPP